MATFLFEIGTEELPADFIDGAIAQWRSLIPQQLDEQFLHGEAIRVYGTPRRLAVVIEGLADKQPDREQEIKGPPAEIAFKDGKPTKAAQGFAKKQGCELSQLEIRETDKGEFVFVNQKISGRPTAEILQELAPQWLTQLDGKRFMRWGDGEIRFSRPVRWIVALLDGDVLNIEIPNESETLTSGRHSAGHRVLHPEAIEITQAKDYLDCLRSGYIEVDGEARRGAIETQVRAAAEKVGGTAQIGDDLLQEVTNLVEWPTAVVGQFDEEFLILPPEVITTVMVKHQRYFPVLKGDGSSGELLPYFVTVSNGDPQKSQTIAEGNARVIRARLADGEFFYKADVAKPLESFLPQLEAVTFQEDLGSLRQKVDRIVEIAAAIADQLGIEGGDRAEIERAALLCKADLVSQMVYEFPELQGVMGEKYARACGEPENVARAIFEHYLPRGAGDRLPQTLAGQVVGIADRLDTLGGIFSLGMLPSGSSDPFALRRAANAVVNITWEAGLTLNLAQLLQAIAAKFAADRPETTADRLLKQLEDFFLQRIATLLQEECAVDYDLVNAILLEDDPEYTERALTDLLDVRDRALFLQGIRRDGTLEKIYETVNRSARLAKQGDLDTATLDPQAVVKPELFQKSSERGFYEALGELLPKTKAARDDRNYGELVAAIAEITPVVTNFFDGEDSVLVMDPDPYIRRNRLNLIALLRNHARVLADFGPIVKS
jgi:glycyl-tRNA synthetase beta chain